VNPSDGDTEFQKTWEATKQLKSFRGAYSESTSHSERVWEVDCNRVMVHEQSHFENGGDSPFDMKQDELLVGDQRYTREGGGSWQNVGYAGDRGSAKWYCDNLARGTMSDLLPDMLTLIRHAMTEKGSKKAVNGVQCREWKFAIKGAVTGTQPGSVCIGVDDHLPYEMTMEGGGHFTYSDYNRPIQFDAPEAILQTAGSAGGN
jgi:hypothetical protein